MKKCLGFIFLILVSLHETHAQSDSLADVSDSQDQEIVAPNAIASPPVENEVSDSITGNEGGTCGLYGGELLKNSRNSLKPSGFLPPAALMIYGLTIKGHSGLYSSFHIRQDMQSMFPAFYTPADEYIQYVPLVAAYATGFISGTRPRHSNGRRLWMFVQAQVLTSVATLALKHYTNELRPNGSDHLSFPSGHTAQAFMGAALFDVEYPGQMKGLKIGLYSLAGLTGMLAMMNDRHWANDVLFGAGLGMLSVRLLYWSEQHWKKKKTVSR